VAHPTVRADPAADGLHSGGGIVSSRWRRLTPRRMYVGT
jgi:hypothetical protein